MSNVTSICALAFVVLTGCASGSAAGTVTPGHDAHTPRADSPSGEAMGGSADELHLQRRKLSADLMSTLAAAQTDVASCESACDLSVSICTIAERLCDIADGHAGSDYYQRLCREAKQDCRNAQEVCANCAEQHMRDHEGGDSVSRTPPSDVPPSAELQPPSVPSPTVPPQQTEPPSSPPDSRP